MTTEVILPLRTTPNEFIRWLKKLTQDVCQYDFPTEKGHCRIEPPIRVEGQPHSLVMLGWYATPVDEYTELTGAMGPGIAFSLIPQSGITVMKMELVSAVFAMYYNRLLTAIMFQWPEYYDGIDDYYWPMSWPEVKVEDVEKEMALRLGQGETLALKCREFRNDLMEKLEDWPEELPLKQENMADRLGIAYDYLRQLCSEHKKCCGFDWKMFVKQHRPPSAK